MSKLTALLTVLLCAGSALAGNKRIPLTTTNTVAIRDEINSESVATAEAEIIKLALNRKLVSEPIYLVIDSPGGSITDGEDFIQFAKTVPNLHTVTLFAASMASAIVESLPGRRYVTENGTLMFHRAKGGFSGQFETGEVESRLDWAKQIVRLLETRNASRMCLSLPAYKEKVVNEYWLYGANAVSQKVADEVVDVVCSRELVLGKDIFDVNFMGMRFKVSQSKCPLLKGAALVGAGDERIKAAFQAYNTRPRYILDLNAK